MKKEDAIKYLKQLYPNGGHCWLDDQRMEAIGMAVKALQEEPVSEELEEAEKEWLTPQLDKSYANYGEGKMMELTHFDGYAMLDAIEFGAKWQKEQMMTKAIDGEIQFGTVKVQKEDIKEVVKSLREGEKIKVIVIKQE